MDGTCAVLFGRLALLVRHGAEYRYNEALGGRLALRPNDDSCVSYAQLAAALRPQEMIKRSRIGERRGGANWRIEIL